MADSSFLQPVHAVGGKRRDIVFPPLSPSSFLFYSCQTSEIFKGETASLSSHLYQQLASQLPVIFVLWALYCSMNIQWLCLTWKIQVDLLKVATYSVSVMLPDCAWECCCEECPSSSLVLPIHWILETSQQSSLGDEKTEVQRVEDRCFVSFCWMVPVCSSLAFPLWGLYSKHLWSSLFFLKPLGGVTHAICSELLHVSWCRTCISIVATTFMSGLVPSWVFTETLSWSVRGPEEASLILMPLSYFLPSPTWLHAVVGEGGEGLKEQHFASLCGHGLSDWVEVLSPKHCRLTEVTVHCLV